MTAESSSEYSNPSSERPNLRLVPRRVGEHAVPPVIEWGPKPRQSAVDENELTLDVAYPEDN